MSRQSGKKAIQFRDSDVNWATHEAIKSKTPWVAQTFLWLYLAFFIVFSTYAMTVRVPVKVEGTGRLTSSQEPVVIKAPVGFVIGQLLVRENQSVQQGQILLTSRESLSPENRNLLMQFNRQVSALLDKPNDPNCSKCLKEIEAASKTYLAINAQGEVQALITPLHDLIRDFSSQIQAYNQIESNVTDLRLNVKLAQQKVDQIISRKAQNLMARELEQLQSEIVANKTRIQEKFQNSSLTISRTKELLKSRLTEFKPKLELLDKVFNIQAPYAGQVANLKPKGIGELVNAGQTILEIVPAGTSLIAKVDIRNEDISEIKVGQKVDLIVDAMAEADYGRATGTVREILRREEAADTGAQAVKTFPVVVDVNEKGLSRQGEFRPFLVGMSVTAQIVSETETLAKTFLKDVVKIRDRAGVP